MPLWTPTGGWCFSPVGIGQGIAAFALTYGSGTLQRWLGGVLVTILGPSAETIQRVDNAMAVATNANAPWFRGNLPEFAELIDALVVPTQIVGEAMMKMAYATNGAVYDIVHARIPAATAAADAYTNGVRTGIVTWTQQNFDKAYHDLEGLAAQDLAAADAYTNGVRTGIVTWTQQNFDKAYNDLEGLAAQVTATSARRAQVAVTYADTVATDVLAYAEQETAALRADLQATTSWADNQITATRHQAATDAANAANTAIADQNRTVSTTLAPVWAGTAESLNHVGEGVKQLAPTLAPAVTAISLATPPDLQVALQSLTNGLRNTATAVDQCALPNCREKNTYGHTAHGVGTLMEMGAILALLAGAVRDPSGTAHELTSLFGTLARDTAKGIDDLVKAF